MNEMNENEEHFFVLMDSSDIPEEKPLKVGITAPKQFKQYQNGIYKNFGLKNTVRGSKRRDN